MLTESFMRNGLKNERERKEPELYLGLPLQLIHYH